jgi:hypothetical protein
MIGVPMTDKQILAYLRLGHGTFNTIVFMLIVYQGILGYRVRKARLAGISAGGVNRRHRKNGPVLVVLGIAGFFAGIVLVYLDQVPLLKYPLHFINGTLISMALVGMFLISKRIRAADSQWRTAHYGLGTTTIVLYVIQLFLGLAILL